MIAKMCRLLHGVTPELHAKLTACRRLDFGAVVPSPHRVPKGHSALIGALPELIKKLSLRRRLAECSAGAYRSPRRMQQMGACNAFGLAAPELRAKLAWRRRLTESLPSA